MDRTADLDGALKFVIGRIEEQATLSGEPLNEGQSLLLNYLPNSMEVSWDPEFPTPIPRNIDLEQVCAMGKAAYLEDRRQSPTSRDWEFAAAVFALNRHPMRGLLQLAGVKQRKPWWDRFLLAMAALLLIGATMAIMLLQGIEPWTPAKWVNSAIGYIAFVFLIYWGSRRIEERRLIEEIEQCRRSSCFSAR